jgi:hypothetical protein
MKTFAINTGAVTPGEMPRDVRGRVVMKRWEAVERWILVLGPLAVLLLTVPLVIALELITRPQPVGVATAAGWSEARERVERALAARDAGGAVRAWHGAHAAALASRHWSAMLDVGDLALRIGETTRLRGPAAARARESYLIALFRARRDGAIGGVLRAAEAFAALGEPELAEQALRVAERLVARGEPGARESYRLTAERLRARAVSSTGVD